MFTLSVRLIRKHWVETILVSMFWLINVLAASDSEPCHTFISIISGSMGILLVQDQAVDRLPVAKLLIHRVAMV